MDEVRILGRCEECNCTITDEKDCYINEDGEYFCDIDCLLEHYKIVKVEA